MRGEAFWALGLFGAIIVIAALVNRFAATHRSRVRRTVILFIFYVLALGVFWVLTTLGASAWAERFRLIAELLQAFTVVSLGATALFSVLFPAAGVVLPMLASDLLVGLGYLAATLGVLSMHGLNPTGALASAAVVSAVLAISLQSTLGNIVGGVALQLDGSVHEGDWIQLENGKQGRVRAIRWRHTIVETRDWSTIIVPNAQLLSNNITILGKRDGRSVPQRYWVWFNVDFRFPPTTVIQTVIDALHAAPIAGVANDPPPNCVCMDFGRDMRTSFATYAVRYWLTDLAHDDPTNSRVRARIYSALQRAGIPLAIPANMTWIQVEDETRAAKKSERQASDRFRALRRLPLFRALNNDEVRTLADGVSAVIYTPGEIIARQGSAANWLYILASGTVEVRMEVDPDGPTGPAPASTKVLSTLTAPEVFGEMGLMTGESRAADVVALTDVECLRLDKETFERVLLARPEIATELSDRLAKRRVELIAAREGLDENAKVARASMERDEILGAIRSFFSL
ncbi:MAG TPA: mechanosensitive ion channel family protein [Labilithrix sp.]|nr:mechanosensitive ion channel family protein [Labilithrix sp.]